jgi:hypothetical protein
MDELKSRLTEVFKDISAKSPLAEAIRYTLAHWNGLTMFLTDGRVEVDTNTVERSMRPIGLGRNGPHPSRKQALRRTRCQLNRREAHSTQAHKNTPAAAIWSLPGRSTTLGQGTSLVAIIAIATLRSQLWSGQIFGTPSNWQRKLAYGR